MVLNLVLLEVQLRTFQSAEFEVQVSEKKSKKCEVRRYQDSYDESAEIYREKRHACTGNPSSRSDIVIQRVCLVTSGIGPCLFQFSNRIISTVLLLK